MLCPVCERPGAELRYRMKDRFFGASPGEFLLYRCGCCGLLFQNERELTTARLEQFYPTGYWWEHSAGNGAMSTLEKKYRDWMVRHDQLHFVRSLFPETSGLRLLDVGCGNGTFVGLANEAGFDAYGLEQSGDAVRIARQACPDKIFHGAERDLAQQSERFDVVTLFHSLEHIPGPLGYLKEIQKLLRRPGKLVVQVPNTESLQAKILGRRWYGLDCPRHIYNYTPFSLLYLLGRSGFRIQRIHHFSLRDNAAALVSSLFPGLDPMSQRVKLTRKQGTSRSMGLAFKEAVYLGLLLLAQPTAFLESTLGRGATITVYATLDEPPGPKA